QDVEKHAHPGGRHVNVDYSVVLMLLSVGRRCDKEPNIHSPDEKNCSRNREERNHLASKWVEIRRSCVFVPIDSLFTHEFFAPSTRRASECLAVTTLIPQNRYARFQRAVTILSCDSARLEMCVPYHYSTD